MKISHGIYLPSSGIIVYLQKKSGNRKGIALFPPLMGTQCWVGRNSHYLDQLNTYDRLTGDNPHLFQSILNCSSLDNLVKGHLESASGQPQPVGLVYLMEGADAILEPAEVEERYQRGVRIIGPAWRSTKYCGGTNEPGSLTREWIQLVNNIESVDRILDISHMDKRSVLDTFNRYNGKIIATRINSLTLLKSRPSNRFLSDYVICELADQGGVIGVVSYNLFLDTNWEKGDPGGNVSLSVYGDHIDYISQ